MCFDQNTIIQRFHQVIGEYLLVLAKMATKRSVGDQKEALHTKRNNVLMCDTSLFLFLVFVSTWTTSTVQMCALIWGTTFRLCFC